MSLRISKSKFKPQALRIFREIEKNQEEIIITDRGVPVLKIAPYSENGKEGLEALRNTVLEYQDPMEPVGQYP